MVTSEAGRADNDASLMGSQSSNRDECSYRVTFLSLPHQVGLAVSSETLFKTFRLSRKLTSHPNHNSFRSCN